MREKQEKKEMLRKCVRRGVLAFRINEREREERERERERESARERERARERESERERERKRERESLTNQNQWPSARTCQQCEVSALCNVFKNEGVGAALA
jgi:hypothetical protein